MRYVQENSSMSNGFISQFFSTNHSVVAHKASHQNIPEYADFAAFWDLENKQHQIIF